MTTPTTTLINDEIVNNTAPNEESIDLTTDAEPILPVNLNAIGYEKAEKHRGNALALENLLNRVLRGYLVDERNDDERRQRQQKRIDGQILDLEKQATDARTRIRQINESELPRLHENIEDLESEILQIRKDEVAGLRDPNHLDRMKLRLYGLATAFGTLFVYLFYVSSFYAGFLRDVATEMQQAGPDGQSAVLSAIFSKQAFVTLHFHWAGPLLLFVFGIGLHVLWDVPGRWGKVGFWALLAVVMFTDGLIAYFVEKKIHEMKIMMGMANQTDAHAWWTSAEFWLVMAMGFVAALAWSLLLHAWMHEISKKDVNRITALDIRYRLDKQQEIKTQMAALKAKLVELEGQISRLELDIKALEASRQQVVFSPSELEKYVTDFYDGWLTYVNNRMGNDATLRAECDTVMRVFRMQHLPADTPTSTANSLAVKTTPQPAQTVLNALISLWFIGVSLLASIGSSWAGVPPTRPANFVVLLDLSDRLLAPDQFRRDQVLVQTVFAQFEARVRQQQIVFAKDCFRVVIAPQKGITYRPETYMDALYLDMSTLKMAEKRQRLDALRTDLARQLNRLYQQAMAGKRQTRDFAGCDLWQYVNEQLPTDLKPDADNLLVVLTDGYFDFEKNTHGLTQGNRATDSRMLERLRRDPNWQQTLAHPTEGLLPVTKRLPNLSVCVAEVRPKVDHLNEADLLTALWDKWLRELQVRHRAVLIQSSQPKAIAGLTAFLAKQ